MTSGARTDVRYGVATLLVVLLVAGTARAQSLWAAIAGPDPVADLVDEGKLHLVRAVFAQATRDDDTEVREGRAALRLFERALAARPDVDVEYWAVVAAGHVDRRDDKTCTGDAREGCLAVVAHADAFRALAPADPRFLLVTWEAALARSKLGSVAGPDQERLLGEAVAEYDLSIRYGRDYDPTFSYVIALGRSTIEPMLIFGNQAELLMAAGRLDDSIAAYREALSSPPANRSSLPYYGIAVAYDRDGQEENARAAMREALLLDRANMDLEAESVFFVPDGDIHYYRALAAIAQGRNAAAMGHLERFLHSPATTRYHARARVWLERLRRLPPGPPEPVPDEVEPW